MSCLTVQPPCLSLALLPLILVAEPIMVPGKVCFGKVPPTPVAAETTTLGLSVCSGGDRVFSSWGRLKLLGG